jgi:hypothetical protein
MCHYRRNIREAQFQTRQSSKTFSNVAETFSRRILFPSIIVTGGHIIVWGNAWQIIFPCMIGSSLLATLFVSPYSLLHIPAKLIEHHKSRLPWANLRPGTCLSDRSTDTHSPKVGQGMNMSMHDGKFDALQRERSLRF